MNINLKPPNNNIAPENLQSDDYVTKVMFSYCKLMVFAIPLYFTLTVGGLITYKRYQIKRQFEEVFLECSDQFKVQFKNDIIKPFIKDKVLNTSLSTSKEDLVELYQTTVCKPDC